MALQTVSQILAPTNAPYINGSAARLRFSAAFLRALYQGLVEKDGKGIDDNFVSASEAEDSAQIIVHRPLPTIINPREIGSSKNGAAYSQNQHYTQTESVGIEILQVVDDPILIPRFTQDHLPIDILANQVEVFANRLSTILNGATAASKYLATYTATPKFTGSTKEKDELINETVVDLTDKDSIVGSFVIANGKLDEGDESHAIDIFPRKTRICVIKTTFGPILKSKGIVQLGGANEVYRILKASGVTGDGERLEDDGYVGDIDGVEIREISNESLKHASLFLGFPAYELKNSAFLGYIASSYANARGVSTSKQTKVVDEVNGQGVRLLPYVKFGVACWYPKGNSLLVSKALDVFGELKALFSGSTITFKVKGAASRLFPLFSVLTFNSSTSVSLTATCYDDWNNDHLVGAAYVETEEPITTVDAFLTAYNGTLGTDYVQKGTCDISVGTGGTITPSALTDEDYLTVLAIADDGSVGLITKQYNA